MPTFKLSLDIHRKQVPGGHVTLRQGDRNSTTLEIAITDDGAELDLDGYEEYLVMRLPRSMRYFEQKCEANGSVATVTLDEEHAAAIAGHTDIAYVELRQGESEIASTGNFSVDVLPDGRSGGELGDAYSSRLEQSLSDVSEAAEQARIAAESASYAAGSATKAADSAALAAEQAQKAAAEALKRLKVYWTHEEIDGTDYLVMLDTEDGD